MHRILRRDRIGDDFVLGAESHPCRATSEELEHLGQRAGTLVNGQGVD
ncbi:hypothetical protein DV517_67670 [Streptomyces sp. S816]|uniref:Uncharacterized protein n=1 Tax=Streptomyces murinus TaxID=33900 RepID=A0A7W3NTE9_STRMR|nr:hypothetical protein [Streptomyces murinus]TGZ12683.1 hypothetical protein DV517_67670 [Streptomyces sp. S816]